MTSDTQDELIEGPDAIHESIQALAAQVATRTRANRARHRASVTIGVLLIAVICVSLSWLSGQTSQVDAETLVFRGRMIAQENLPGGREVLQETLEEAAPELVSDVLDALIATLPEMRQWVAAEMNSNLDAVNARFEESSVAYLEQAIRESREQIEANSPDAENKLELVTQLAAEHFRDNVNSGLDQIYPAYAEEMDRITAYVDRLMHTDRAQLTPEEQQRRELIETLLVLVRRAQDGQA